MVKFYELALSPPCRVVDMTLAALGNVEFEKIEINVIKGEGRTPEFQKINPQGQIPTIVDGDFVVTQSVAIARYLCNAYGSMSNNKKLYPNDLRVRTRVDEICFLVTDLRAKIIEYANIVGVFFNGAKGANDDHLEKTQSALATLDRILSKSDYIAANYLTFADFYTLSVVEFVHLTNFKGWGEYPNVLKWEKRLAELPYYKEAYKKGCDGLKQFYQSKIEENSKAENKS